MRWPGLGEGRGAQQPLESFILPPRLSRVEPNKPCIRGLRRPCLWECLPCNNPCTAATSTDTSGREHRVQEQILFFIFRISIFQFQNPGQFIISEGVHTHILCISYENMKYIVGKLCFRQVERLIYVILISPRVSGYSLSRFKEIPNGCT